MPGIDGLRLSKLMRSDSRFKSTRLILLSGFEAPPAEVLRECGIKLVVPKPLRASELYNAIVTACNGSLKRLAGSERKSDTVVNSTAPGAHILLVEDNAINQEVASEMIRHLGHTCECLANGAEAQGVVAEGRHDLVLMDCQMPGLDGYEATVRIRKWESENGEDSRIPIVALTAHAMKGDRERCLAAGMDDYLSKPLQADELAAMLTNWLGTTRRSPTSEAEADREAAIVARCSGNRALAARLLRKFVSETAVEIAAISTALENGDPGQIAEAAHRLKGAAGSLALDASEAAAAELEKLGLEGNIAGAAGVMATLQEEVQRIAATPILGEASLEDAASRIGRKDT